MLNFFYNGHEGRLRAFWRLLFQFVLYILAEVVLGGLVLFGFVTAGGMDLGGEAISRVVSDPAFLAASGIASLAAVLISVWIAGRFFDRRRPFAALGLRLEREWWLDLGFGLLLGAFLMTAIFLVELWAGWIEVTGTFETSDGMSFLPAILAPAMLFLCVGTYEELLSRGYQLTNMAEGLNYPALGPRGAVVLAWVISSSLFGLLHLANPNATLVSTVNIAFAGLLLGTGYILTGRLGIPIGLHITWNFFQGNVFGFPVSGMDDLGATFISIEQGGPSLFTGGVFGPEAGLLDIAATIVGSLLIWLWVRVRSGKAKLQASIAEPAEGTKKPASEV
ncbi:MAG: CAAX amino terminal protease family protein [uncultured Rubrobacteraceae bacterium]|uniref:CAAX amino terminal protease family protein n=1 Tax=uncultured Rubrobacteraceae bacterium TaxID=349277 RepID=A0A6J4QH92_9ACTN|nr:MAG: CAAX amino terminal protease family protein [uncultured Rubrobacteraceae bacterium]